MRRKAIVLFFDRMLGLYRLRIEAREPVGTTPASPPAPPPTAQQPPSDFRDQDGRTQLMRTVETSDVTEVEKLIDAGANVNEQSYTGITALQTAAGMGKTDIVRLLIRRGADVNQKAQGGFYSIDAGGFGRAAGGCRDPAQSRGRPERRRYDRQKRSRLGGREEP